MSPKPEPPGSSTAPNAALREAAEYPNSFIPLGPGDERIETSRYTLCMSAPSFANTVQRQRFRPDEIDEVLAEVRALLRQRGRTRTQWEIGSAAQPANLVTELLDRGLTLDQDPVAVALTLTAEPPVPRPELIARRVTTFAEFRAANEVQMEAFAAPADEIAEYRASLDERWRSSPTLMHAVWLEGEIVGAGTCAWTPCGLALFGGATVPRARGQGVYAALISARWREAVSRGLAALVTQAGGMSRPILERIGFTPVGRIEILLDEFADAPEN